MKNKKMMTNGHGYNMGITCVYFHITTDRNINNQYFVIIRHCIVSILQLLMFFNAAALTLHYYYIALNLWYVKLNIYYVKLNHILHTKLILYSSSISKHCPNQLSCVQVKNELYAELYTELPNF